MKQYFFKSQQLFLITLFAATLFTFSCKKDGDDPVVLLPNLNGLYVTGTNTVASDLGNAASKVNLAILDPGKGAMVNNLPDVYGRFIHIGANSTIQLTYVKDGVGTTYGAPDGGSLDSAFVAGGSINDVVIHGTMLKDGPAIKVTKAGLYYLFADYNKLTFSLSEVRANMIGDATPGQWATGTLLPLKSSDALKTVFEATNVPLFGAAGYRYRFNDGWHFYEDNTVITLSSMGVLSYGTAWDTGINDVGFFLDNIPNKETGLFTVTLTYDSKTGEWDEVKTKTGELLVDYSDNEYGWFGNAYYVSGTTEGAWDAIHHIKKPVKDNNLYNWTWELELLEGRSFVLRENATPGAWITYGGAAKLGSAFDDGSIVKENGQDNYFVAKGGNYKITFTINAEDDGRILTIEPN